MGNTSEGELSLRRHSKEEKKPVDQVINGGVLVNRRGCGGRRVNLQSSGVRSCEKAISIKRASIVISGSAGNQRRNKGVPIAGDEFAEKQRT